MTWRDHLQPASFRGVSFHIKDASGTYGRRVALHEYPLRDKPYAEDLGRKAREISFDAYVIGHDYMTGRDALIEAVEKPGAGTLVHPYYGQMRVTVTACRVRESTREGGMARFSLTMVEAGELAFPVATVDTQSIVETRADDALDVIKSAFADAISVDGVPGWVGDAAQTVVDEAMKALRAIDPNIAGLASTLKLPEVLADELVTMIGELGDRSTLYRWGDKLPVVPLITASRRLQAANQVAIVNLVQRAALVESARAASRASYDSREQAIEARDGVADALDLQLETADDRSYAALQSVRIALVRDITTRAADLSRILRYVPKTTEPALVVAHRLYRDATREADIISRNRAGRPGFLQGGQALEVLSEGAQALEVLSALEALSDG